MAKSKIKNEMKCSFCGKTNSEVGQLVAATDKLCICDECIITCVKLLIYGEPKPVLINLDDDKNNKDDNA